MATIIHKMKKGRPYYYAVQSARVNGKPRIVWQKYLGTVDAIIARAEGSKPPKPKEAVLFDAGGVAGLSRIAQRLGLLDLIDAQVPKRDQGPSAGHYIVLAALNRALAPCSKLAIGDWYEQTVLRRLWRFDQSAFSSQRFWDHMSMVSEEAIETIQTELAARVRREFGLDAEVLLYDTTNFFTFLATSNDRCTVAQRGHSKAKRHDLRQVGLALLVTRDFQVPLFHKVYDGNIPDVSLFPALAKELVARHRSACGARSQATLVFDKGNVSDDAMEQLVVAGQPFVAAVPLNRLPELAATPFDRFEDVPGFPGTRAFEAQAQAWGASCRAVVAYTESFFTQQLQGVTHNLVKCQKKLMDIEQSLRKWREGKARGKRPTTRQVQASVKAILSAQLMAELFQIAVDEDNGLPALHYSVDHAALDRLTHEHLGRTLLLAVKAHGNAKEVIGAYRSLTGIEDVFKNMKNVDFLRWQPAYHWTDQKLKVHGLYCVLALLLATLARKVAVHAGLDLSLPALLDELCAIREVAVLYPQGTRAHRKDHITLSRMSPTQRKLAEALEIAQVLEG
ncbi:MAG TPA: IS1634 family transposase [Candidatus Hydrogenedentes bacterium]|nr:IS1634 family transposase [Candidatus Hydrogenedentota bacterium]HPG66316.1 IS1634 family transposase [Candidatus Hydrogenedentota bacterium]